MNPKTKTILKHLSFFLVFSLSVVAIQAFAVFTPPSGNPLSENISTPMNTGPALQRKEGGAIFEFMRIMGLMLIGGKLEVAETIKINGGNPAQDKVLVSDATGLASWRDVTSLPGVGGGGGNSGVVPVSLGGTGLTTIPARSIWVANSLDSISTVSPSGGNSIRVNASGTAWEQYTPLVSSTGGTTNRLSKFTGANSLGDSNMTDDGTTIEATANFKVGKNLIFDGALITINSDVTNLELSPNKVHYGLSSLPPGAPVRTIHGFAPLAGQSHVNGQIIYITNFWESEGFIIKNNSTTTALENRIQMSDNSDLTLAENHTLTLIYDSGFPGGSRWRQVLIAE